MFFTRRDLNAQVKEKHEKQAANLKHCVYIDDRRPHVRLCILIDCLDVSKMPYFWCSVIIILNFDLRVNLYHIMIAYK